jgi:xanthine dehydrogenase YagR molybdenum-binding subunit
VPAAKLEASAQTPGNPGAGRFAMHSFGAQFAEVRVHAETGEVRVPRLLGVFSVGRIINPKTGRSQLLGGMTMGLSMALYEHSVLDRRFSRSPWTNSGNDAAWITIVRTAASWRAAR